jgi:hypothetical protein
MSSILTLGEINVLLESLKYSKQSVENAQRSPRPDDYQAMYKLKIEKLNQLEAIERKLRDQRDALRE